MVLAATDHGRVLGTGLGHLQLERDAASLGDVPQNRIPELRGQRRASPDDDPEQKGLILRPARRSERDD